MKKKKPNHALYLLLAFLFGIILMSIAYTVAGSDCESEQVIGKQVKELPVEKVCFYQEIFEDGSLSKPFIDTCDWEGET